jgi:hypothetical protein
MNDWPDTARVQGYWDGYDWVPLRPRKVNMNLATTPLSKIREQLRPHFRAELDALLLKAKSDIQLEYQMSLDREKKL